MEKIQAFYQVRFLQSLSDQNVYMSNKNCEKKVNETFSFCICD